MMIRRTGALVFSALAAATAAGSARAEETARPTWSGFYLGGGAGIGTMKLRQTADLTPLFGYVATLDNSGDGAFGTVQAGYDVPLKSWLVLGAFADFDLGNVH